MTTGEPTYLSSKDPRNARIFRFVDEYAKDLNGTQAAIRVGYSQHTAGVQASRLLTDVKVQQLIDAKLADVVRRNGLRQDYIIQKLIDIVEADANEICQHQRVCCRYCWGTNFCYQETPAELNDRKWKYDRAVRHAKFYNKPIPVWDNRKEVGYILTRNPHPQCPECGGEGVGRVFFQDTRYLSHRARAAYNGIKFGRGTISFKLADKLRALELLGRYLGLFKR